MEAKKFLCICEGGTVRSGALAWSLRYNFGQTRVFQASYGKSPQEDLDLLSAWADYIIVLEAKFADKFLMKWKDKVRVLDVGPDIWMNPLHKELQEIVSGAAQGWSKRNWKF
jgi:hypothetical protein